MDVQRVVSFVIRTLRAGCLSLQRKLQNAIWSVDSNLPLKQTDTLEMFYNRSLARTSFTLLLLAIAGGMALVLGLVSIYGAVSYSVTQRTREFGIRLALGAPVANVTIAFVRSGLMLSALGCGCGLAAVLALAPLIKLLLFSVGPSDPFAYAAMSTSLIITAAVTSYFPEKKATKVDPVEALRRD